MHIMGAVMVPYSWSKKRNIEKWVHYSLQLPIQEIHVMTTLCRMNLVNGLRVAVTVFFFFCSKRIKAAEGHTKSF